MCPLSELFRPTFFSSAFFRLISFGCRFSPVIGLAFLFTLGITLLSARHLEAIELQKPNIIFMMADDLGWADVDFHGGNVPTPNLDRMRCSGVELRQHCVAPVCSPTRAGLMTGRYWSRFGVTAPQATRALPFETVTLPRALKECGYDTCLTGKWHLGSKPSWGPNLFGLDHSYGSLGGGVGPYNHFYKRGEFERTWHRNGQLIEEDGHVTDLIANEAIQWLQSRTNRPFFLYVPFTAVHLPIKEPDEYLDRVPSEIRGEVDRQYAACIIHLDDAVGRVLGAVDAAGKSENTIIVFTSDNGGSTAENNGSQYPPDDYPRGRLTGNNRPLRGQKGEPYEGGIRVPTLVCWPGRVDPGTVCDIPLHITDWMPTFCSLAGYQAASDLKWDGTDVWPAITGRSPLPERSIYSAAPHFRARVLRFGQWKLIVWVDREPGESLELFDIEQDPSERINLAADRPDKVAELQALLQASMVSDLDTVVEAEE